MISKISLSILTCYAKTEHSRLKLRRADSHQIMYNITINKKSQLQSSFYDSLMIYYWNVSNVSKVFTRF